MLLAQSLGVLASATIFHADAHHTPVLLVVSVGTYLHLVGAHPLGPHVAERLSLRHLAHEGAQTMPLGKCANT